MCWVHHRFHSWVFQALANQAVHKSSSWDILIWLQLSVGSWIVPPLKPRYTLRSPLKDPDTTYHAGGEESEAEDDIIPGRDAEEWAFQCRDGSISTFNVARYRFTTDEKFTMNHPVEIHQQGTARRNLINGKASSYMIQWKMYWTCGKWSTIVFCDRFPPKRSGVARRPPQPKRLECYVVEGWHPETWDIHDHRISMDIPWISRLQHIFIYVAPFGGWIHQHYYSAHAARILTP